MRLAQLVTSIMGGGPVSYSAAHDQGSADSVTGMTAVTIVPESLSRKDVARCSYNHYTDWYTKYNPSPSGENRRIAWQTWNAIFGGKPGIIIVAWVK